VSKGPEAFRTISEAATEVGVAQHVLRFWETKFSFIRPMKRAGGRRFYRPHDLAVLRGVRRLLHEEGYTIVGVQKLHRERGISRFLEAGVHVAAICGATAGLARAGLLNSRRHTSAAAEYLLATGYAGGDSFVDERAVADNGLITAGPQSPVQFARATLTELGLASDRTLDAYEAVFHRGDPSGFPVLMQAQHAA